MKLPTALPALAWVFTLGLQGCGGDPLPETRTARASDSTTITADTVTVLAPITVTAQLYVEHDAPVLARTAGVIESVYVQLGNPVTEGQLLASLESTDQEIALAQAREGADNTNRALTRIRSLAESGYVSTVDSETARFAATKAALSQRQAQRDYDLTRIRAPFAGIITSRIARPRRLAKEGDSLFRVTAMAPLLVSVRIPENGASNIQPGTTAQVQAAGETLSGRILHASPVVDAASGTREVILQVPARPGLRPGTTVTVRVGGERRRVVAIPRWVLRDESFVVVVANGRAIMRQVQLGAELPDGRVEVVSGLSAGERLARGSGP
ncbi:MAG: efflux RND transporter periplasmic adaptor subunit [Gemmatimonadota bacterium]